MDPMPFKTTVTCPRCNQLIKLEGYMSLAVGLAATRILRLGCDDCQKVNQQSG